MTPAQINELIVVAQDLYWVGPWSHTKKEYDDFVEHAFSLMHGPAAIRNVAMTELFSPNLRIGGFVSWRPSE